MVEDTGAEQKGQSQLNMGLIIVVVLLVVVLLVVLLRGGRGEPTAVSPPEPEDRIIDVGMEEPYPEQAGMRPPS